MTDISKEIDQARAALVAKHGAPLLSTAIMHNTIASIAAHGLIPNGMLTLLTLSECVAARIAELGKTPAQYVECSNDVQRSSQSLLELTAMDRASAAIDSTQTPVSPEVAQALHKARRL